jgi:large subunit ribosomal protein L18e
MGIDLIRGGRTLNRGIRSTKTSNTYIKTLIKLYAFLARRTDASFNQVIHKRLNQSRLNRYPISISRIVKTLSHDNAPVAEGKTKFNSRIVAVVGSVTNDNRFLSLPEGLRVCALRFTSEARNRITAAKG